MRYLYVKPTAELLEYEAESVLCKSGKNEGYDSESEFDGLDLWE